MDFSIFLMKSVIMLVLLFFMAAPFYLEWRTFKKDKENKISFARFRLVVFTFVYVIAVTVVLYLLKELLLWLQSLPIIQQLGKSIAVSSRVQYCIEVFFAILVNIIVGFAYVLLSKFARIGLKKMPAEDTEAQKENRDQKPSFRERVARAVIKTFDKEKWFFVGRVFQGLFIVLSIFYALSFLIYQIPAFFGADWIPYAFISRLFTLGYMHPSITLLAICQIAFFLLGIQQEADACPTQEERTAPARALTAVDLLAIDKEVQRQFGGYYVCNVDMSKSLTKQENATKHKEMTQYIAMAVQADRRNPQENKEIYLNCLDRIVGSDSNLVINGCFNSEFSMYFLRYLSIILARGDNLIFVCNSDAEIDAIYDYIDQGLSAISSFYCPGYNAGEDSFDDPIWKIVKLRSDSKEISRAAINEASILVTALPVLCASDFEQSHETFIHLVDTVVFVDTLRTVNTFGRQVSTLNICLKQVFENNAVKAKNGMQNEDYRISYMAKQVRYICFDPSGTSGLDKILRNLLAVKFESADAMFFGPNTIVRCYNFEARPDENGRTTVRYFLDTDEEIGAIMNMAVLCQEEGADSVTVLANERLPYENYMETIAAHKGSLTVSDTDNCIRINQYHYNPDGYSVIIAMDSEDDLPATVRKCAALASDKPTLIMIFSRQYILREYYHEHIAELWGSRAFGQIPVESSSEKDAAHRIVIMANTGGISTEAVLDMVSDISYFEEEVKKSDIEGILHKVLALYEISTDSAMDIYSHFEYRTIRAFDVSGHFSSTRKIYLRKYGELYAKANGKENARLRIGDVSIPLTVPAKRMTQRYIEGQNLLHNGSIYHIYKIDTDEGVVYAKLATSGKNTEAYEYIQSREYRIEATPDKLEWVKSVQPVVLNGEKSGIKVEKAHICVVKVPAEVLTHGYFEINPYAMSKNALSRYQDIRDGHQDTLVKQTYRKYGDLTKPVYSSESVLGKTQLVSSSDGILVMNIKIVGRLGDGAGKAARLAAVMLDDILKLMFPSAADFIAVCAVTQDSGNDEDTQTVLKRYSKLTLLGDSEVFEGKGFELAIIEDSSTDLGVISALMSAGNDILHTLFSPVFEYLKWYTASAKKSSYLYCGLNHEPGCFDFDALYKVSEIVGDNKFDRQYVDIREVTQYHVCSFCGKKYPKSEKMEKLDDMRLICTDCAQNLVGNNKRKLKKYLDDAKRYLESSYGIVLDDSYEVCFESTEKIIAALKKNQDIVRRGADNPAKAYIDHQRRVHIENQIPGANLAEILVRELTHAWQLKYVPEVPEELAEGHISLVGIQYLRFLGYHSLADVRTRYYESNNDISGKGYRKLAGALLQKPRYRNNPFRYILSVTDGGQEETENIKPVKTVIEDGALGLPYAPEQADRALDGNIRYFYYSNLTATCQAAYDAMLSAIEKHEEMTVVEGCSFEDIQKVSDAIAYDHPELFWYKSFGMRGTEIILHYGASAEEAAVLQKRMEDSISSYLAGIDDSMSAYDVAIRIHARVISAVDYDTIALNKEKQDGGPAKDKIDYLRTICGVFLNGKAVCEGYARAVQYLLQKCGIEAAEAAGHIRKDNGEDGGGHAWNIVRIDGAYYYLDTTWDDSSNTIQNVKQNDMGFRYFCITTDELLRTRNLDMCPVPMPVCSATKANYFHHNDAVLDRYDLEKIKAIAQTAAKNQCKSFAVKCQSKAVYDMTQSQLCVQSEDCGEVLKAAAKHNKQVQTDSYTYICDKDIWTITIKFKFK